MEDFVRKKLANLPLLILVRKTPGFSQSINACLIQGEKRNCHNFKRHMQAIFLSWLIVMLCYFAVLPFENLFQPVYHLVSQKTDTFLSIHAGTDDGIDAQGVLAPIELYDIDDATYRSWNFPATIPRNKLAFLLKRAVEGGAAVVAVDIDLTYAENREEDRHLGELLKTLNESDDPDSPVIVLTRKLLRPLDDQGKVNHEAIFSLPVSFLDEYLPKQKKVFWASTLFNVDKDHVIRRWRNAEVYCSREGHFALLPSLQLLVTIAYNYKSQGHSPDQTLQAISRNLAEVGGGRACDGKQAIPSLKSYFGQYSTRGGMIRLDAGNNSSNVLNLADFGEAERINYRITRVTEQDTKSQIVVTSVTELESSPIRLDVLNRLVLIGVTFEESNDLHSTPVSNNVMPGIYILANGIDTLQSMPLRHDSREMFGPLISLLMLVVGALLLERGANKIWLVFSLLVFFLVGVITYAPGGGSAALPFSVFFVVLWYVTLESLDKFVTKKHEQE